MFSFLKSDRLSPAWTYSAGTMIWRMVLVDRGSLVGECRDPKNKVASFFCIELSTGRVLWKDLRLEEQWWVGIEAVQKNVVLLHAFSTPDMPQHKGIRAFDATSGVPLWRNDDATYWFGYEDRVIAYRDFFERRSGYELDLQSGVLLKTHDSSLDELHQLRRHAAEVQSIPDVTLPEVFIEEEADPGIVALIRKETKGKELSGRIEYIRQEDMLLFNFHVQARRGGLESRLDNHLVVYRLSNNNRIFAEVIGRNLTSYAPDSFFVRRPFVLFVKDQRTLTAVRLWKS